MNYILVPKSTFRKYEEADDHAGLRRTPLYHEQKTAAGQGNAEDCSMHVRQVSVSFPTSVKERSVVVVSEMGIHRNAQVPH